MYKKRPMPERSRERTISREAKKRHCSGPLLQSLAMGGAQIRSRSSGGGALEKRGE